MHPDLLQTTLHRALEGRRLLTHPFYRRWVEGGVSADELRAYSAQYRHFEALLPLILRAAQAGCDDESVRALVQRNLDDECGAHGVAHLELFDRFAAALGAPTQQVPSPAMGGLLDVYSRSAESASRALAAVVAYEAQAPGVASAKADGLVEHFGLSREDVAFWEVHASVDAQHADWALDALARLGAEPDELEATARCAADAWWAFLDEQERARVVC